MESSITQAATKPANWERLKDRVKSWIESEHHCVTAQRISQTFNISRLLGSQLLKEILDTDRRHQISACSQTQDGNVTVFRLNTDIKAPFDVPTLSIFALSSLGSTESIETSHERDMVQWREMVQDEAVPQAQIAGITPADEIECEARTTPMPSDMRGGDGGQHLHPHSSVYNPLSGKESTQSVKAPRMTTASSFFGSQSNKRKQQKMATKPNKAPEKIPASSKQVISKSTTLSRKENHKPSEINRSLTEAKIGNADDFMADEEESDDEMAPVREESSPTKNGKRQSVRPSTEPASHPVRGSIDTFAKEVSKNASKDDPKSHQKRRRKKLVEKTTMVGGYLRTETVTVWEDILSDEENEVEENRKAMAKKIQATKPKSATSMKQKSLMGFFAKK